MLRFLQQDEQVLTNPCVYHWLQKTARCAMQTIHKSAIMPYSAEQMYALVNDIARYSEFVPYCVSSVVHDTTEEKIRATLTLSAKGFHKSFTTINHLEKNHQMKIELADGPFKHLKGVWKFETCDEKNSEVILDLEFELANKMFAMMFGPVFQQVAVKLVDAFSIRATEIYGEPI